MFICKELKIFQYSITSIVWFQKCMWNTNSGLAQHWTHIGAQERAPAGAFIAALVSQRGKNLKEMGFRLAFQCSTLLVAHTNIYAKNKSAAEINASRKTKARIGPSSWFAINDAYLKGKFPSIEKAMEDSGISSSRPLSAMQATNI